MRDLLNNWSCYGSPSVLCVTVSVISIWFCLVSYYSTFNGYFWFGGSNDVRNSSIYCWCKSLLLLKFMSTIGSCFRVHVLTKCCRRDKCLHPIVVFTCAQCLSNVYPDVIVKKFRLAEVIVKIRWMKSNVIVCGKRLMVMGKRSVRRRYFKGFVWWFLF